MHGQKSPTGGRAGRQIDRQGRNPAPHGPRKGGRKKTTPPPAEEAKGPLTPLKIRAIFFDKPFSMQLNLAKTGNWSPKSRGGEETQSRKC